MEFLSPLSRYSLRRVLLYYAILFGDANYFSQSHYFFHSSITTPRCFIVGPEYPSPLHGINCVLLISG